MKKYFLGAAALLALTACSNDETVDLNQDGNVISFAVTANNPSRAPEAPSSDKEVFNPINLPTSFKVWAAHNNKNYFEGETYTKQGSGSYTSANTHYWPTEGNVTFLAMRNQSGSMSWTPADPTNIAKITGFTVADTDENGDGKYTAANQHDFIYALTSQAKPASGTPGQIGLNFRHGLVQVVFKAQVTNPNLHVDIEGVSVCNAYGKADVTFPKANVTDNKFVDATESTVPSSPFNQAAWNNWSTPTKYDLTFNSVAVAQGGAVNLTAKDVARQTTDWTLLLLPQTTTAWTVTPGIKPENQAGSYFLVKCKIRNVANGSAVQPEDVYLWGSAAAAKNVAVPAAFNWTQGKKYVVTFQFGNGNGGYDPETSDPVLVPISFTVTVDDFAKGDDQPVPMN